MNRGSPNRMSRGDVGVTAPAHPHAPAEPHVPGGRYFTRSSRSSSMASRCIITFNTRSASQSPRIQT